VSERKSVKLSAPITIGTIEAASLTIDPRFRIGWLRNAPTTPVWFVGVVKGAFAGVDFENLDKSKDIAPAAMLANIPAPSGEELSEMIPWLLHIAEKATGQPADVIDQLGPADLLKMLMALLPGMVSLANFQTTSGSGAATLPGSLAGPLPT
jgi:hypothetical protein